MRPRLHLFGHHHEFTDSRRQGVRSIGLDMVTTSYLLIDAASLDCERIEALISGKFKDDMDLSNAARGIVAQQFG